MKLDRIKGPWFAMLVGFLLAGSFVVLQPGQIVKDAGEYDALAQSILRGRYEIDGKASMLREPGYPVFRAMIRVVMDNPSVALWIQVLLFVAVIWLVWDSLRRIDVRLGMVGAWSAALSYGLAVYASRHLLEMFSAFIVAFVAWFAVRAMESDKPWKDLVGCSIASAALILTRVPLALVPVAMMIMLAIYWKKKGWIEIAKRGSVFVGIVALLVMPWVVRNGKTFGVWSITGRTGIQIAARAYKANESWGRLQDSAASLVLGRSLNAVAYPDSRPIILEQWKWVWERFAAWGIDRNEIEADRALRSEAFSIIFRSPGHVMRAALWSIVDTGRLLALPSPLSPEFGIEGMFWPKAEQGAIRFFDRILLIAAHLVQAIWWLGIFAGLYFGFRQYGIRFVPGFVFFAVLIAHVPADNIVRYASPIFPWLVFLAFLGWFALILPRLTRGRLRIRILIT